MKTFLCAWNPKKWQWVNIQEEIDTINITGYIHRNWSCSNNKSIKVGDRIFISKVGEHPKGIFAGGFATSTPFYEKHWSGENNKKSLYIQIEFERIFNPQKDNFLTVDLLSTGKLAMQSSWTPQSSGVEIKQDIAEELEDLWFEFIRTTPKNTSALDRLITPAEVLSEGRALSVVINRYERNPHARKKCLQVHGYSCKVCDFNFEAVYGDIGKEYIHVHHRNPIAQISKKYQINPVHDLVPVCPNCHAMLHIGGKVRSIEELRKKIQTVNNGKDIKDERTLSDA